MNAGEDIVYLIQSELGSVASYLATHVLLCLVPAFFIAGGLSALVPKEAITRFLGGSAPRFVAYPAAALAGSTLAVCLGLILLEFVGALGSALYLIDRRHRAILAAGAE